MIKLEKTIQLPVERSLYLTGHITCESVNLIIKSINEIREADISLLSEYNLLGLKYKPNPIILYINSCGGDVYHSLGLLPLMSEVKNEYWVRTPIDTFCLGVALSMAMVIFLCGRERYCTPLSRFMIHNLFNMSAGDPTDLQTTATESKELERILNHIITSNSKITPAMLKAKVTLYHDWWIPAKEAKKLGMISSILT